MDQSWFLIIAAAAVLFAFVFYNSVQKKFEMMDRKISKLTAEVKKLQSGDAYEEPAVNGRLRELLKEGKNVQAVKEAREAFGYSLLEAKQYVDGLSGENR